MRLLNGPKIAPQRLLMRAWVWFGSENKIGIYYNLACYECALGNLGSARLRLAEVFSLAQEKGCFDKWRLAALIDADLEKIWEHLGEGEL